MLGTAESLLLVFLVLALHQENQTDPFDKIVSVAIEKYSLTNTAMQIYKLHN